MKQVVMMVCGVVVIAIGLVGVLCGVPDCGYVMAAGVLMVLFP